MTNINTVVIGGHLTKDPEVKKFESGKVVCNISMANNQRYKDGTGNWKEETHYIDVAAWNRIAESCGKFLKKGSAILVEGVLKQRRWETPQKEKRSVIEIMATRVHFLDKKGEGPGGEPNRNAPAPSPGINEDDIPF